MTTMAETCFAIQTKILNEMNQNMKSMTQNINVILQKLNSEEARPHSSQEHVTLVKNSLAISFMKPIKLEFPHFSREDPASWCWKNTCLYCIQNIRSGKLTDLLHSQLITCTM